MKTNGKANDSGRVQRLVLLSWSLHTVLAIALKAINFALLKPHDTGNENALATHISILYTSVQLSEQSLHT